MKNTFLFLSIIFISYSPTFAQQDNPETQIKVTVIRKGNFAGSANKWRLWLNGEELCKIRNSSYCETTVSSDTLSFAGKAVGIGTAVAFQWALQKDKVFSFSNLDKPEYFFLAKLVAEKGLQFVKFTMLGEAEAKKLLKKAKKKSF